MHRGLPCVNALAKLHAVRHVPNLLSHCTATCFQVTAQRRSSVCFDSAHCYSHSLSLVPAVHSTGAHTQFPTPSAARRVTGAEKDLSGLAVADTRGSARRSFAVAGRLSSRLTSFSVPIDFDRPATPVALLQSPFLHTSTSPLLHVDSRRPLSPALLKPATRTLRHHRPESVLPVADIPSHCLATATQ